MTAQAILASNQTTVSVFEIRTNSTVVLEPTYQDWVGGKSMLPLPLDIEVTDNSLVYLATGYVPGLSSNDTITSDVIYERTLDRPFQGNATRDIGAIDVFVDGDDLELYQRDWENKPFIHYVGLAGADWSTFEVYAVGKTLDRKLIDNTLKISLSTYTQGTDNLFPVSKYDDGRVKPYLFGRGKHMRPVKINPTVDDGLWQIHDGLLTTSDTENASEPFALCDFVNGHYIGRIRFYVTDSSSVSNTAIDAKPANATAGTGSIIFDTDHVVITVPNQDSSDPVFIDECVINLESKNAVESGLIYDFEMDIELNADSTVDEYVMPLGATSTEVLTKSVVTTKQFTLERNSSAANVIYEYLKFNKTSAFNSETIKINVYAIRCIPRWRSGSFSIIVQESEKRYRLPAFRVADANITRSFPPWVAVYDDQGIIKTSDNAENFFVTAFGSNLDSLFNAMNSIVSFANSASPTITTSATTPEIALYCDEAKPMMTWIRDLATKHDFWLDQDLATSAIELKRRYNNQVFDADGNVNNVAAFEWVDGDIVDLTALGSEPSVKTYEIAYDVKVAAPELSPTVEYTNIFARLNRKERIETNLTEQADAEELASLNRRDGARKELYEVELYGVGLGLNLDDVGTIERYNLRRGRFVIRSIIEKLHSKRTIVKGVYFG